LIEQGLTATKHIIGHIGDGSLRQVKKRSMVERISQRAKS